jgi:hypothetical protein
MFSGFLFRRAIAGPGTIYSGFFGGGSGILTGGAPPTAGAPAAGTADITPPVVPQQPQVLT